MSLPSEEAFENATGLMPAVIVDTILEERKRALSDHGLAWFAKHASLRLRYLYVDRNSFRRKLRGPDARVCAYAWISHWLDAFFYDQESYVERHPHAAILGKEAT